MSLSRRRVLQALAAIPATLPFARSLHAQTAAPPKRLVILMQNNGTQQSNFWPQDPSTLSSPILDSLFKDPTTGADNGLKAKTNIIKGMYVPPDNNGALSANAHDMGFARMFTGAPLLNLQDTPWGGAISVDQILAQQWQQDSLTLAVLASQVEPYPRAGKPHRTSFCYLGPGTLKYPQTDPLSVYQSLFNPPDPKLLAKRQSVLDAVTGNLSEISGRLGPSERTKLDYHLTAIRDLERRLTVSGATCPQRPTPPPDYLAIDPKSEVAEDTYITRLVDDMTDLAVAALQCGLTRIATLQFGYGGGRWMFGWEGINLNCHEEVAHLDTSDTGSTPLNTHRVVLMNQYYASCVARFATKLNAIPEGSGTMLDNTLLVWANEIGRGDHSLANVPVVLIGGAGGAIPKGGRLIDVGQQPFNRLGCTILNVMDHPVAGFGDLPQCGVFDGLL
jgi:hypothetical protein